MAFQRKYESLIGVEDSHDIYMNECYICAAIIYEIISSVTDLFTSQPESNTYQSFRRGKSTTQTKKSIPTFPWASFGYAWLPLKGMLREVSKSFRPYKDLKYDLLKDLLLPAFGATHLTAAYFQLSFTFVTPAIFTLNQLYFICKTLLQGLYLHGWQHFDPVALLQSVFYDAILIQTVLEPLKMLLTLSAWLLNSVCLTIQGASELLIGTPALLVRIPLRLLLNLIVDPQVEDCKKIQAIIDSSLADTADLDTTMLQADKVHAHFDTQVTDYHRPTTLDPNLEAWANAKINEPDHTRADELAYFGLFRDITLKNGEAYNRDLTTQAYEAAGSPQML